MNAYLQKSASTQPRTSLSKFGGKFNSLFIRLLNHLEHADDALPLAHARVGLREGRRRLVLRVARLRERGGRRRLGVEA